MAILRYRLYEIDRVISRTVAYTLVMAALVGVYVGMVVVSQALLGDRLGGSDLIVAGSTLTVAALFQPLRRQVQGRIDRVFNRARYDAARTVESFTDRLRDAIELPVLTADLHRVVTDAVDPRMLSIRIASSPAPAAGSRHGQV